MPGCSAMSTLVQSIYLVDPRTRRLRMAIEVDADGWLEEEVEPMLANLVRTLDANGAGLALAVSVDSSFVLRAGGGEARYEIDEIDTSELLSPHPLHPDPRRLLEAVKKWLQELAVGGREFMTMARLPRRAPEIVGIADGAVLAVRPGAVDPEAAGV